MYHQAPLGSVLRELRASEQRAKNEGGRDAFSMSLIKRAGGAIRFTGKWNYADSQLKGDGAARLATDLAGLLADENMSRRAAYLSSGWIDDIPTEQPELLESLLRAQFHRQSSRSQGLTQRIDELATRLASATCDPLAGGVTHSERAQWLTGLIGVAEFLARTGRDDMQQGEQQ
jgi:CRISPR-associated protein Cmr2